MELLSVFLSPPLFRVLHGRNELGFVDELTFLGKKDGPRVLVLGGRSWRVNHVDWARKQAYVETTEDRGQSRWKGDGGGLRFHLCQAMKAVLASCQDEPSWSKRATDKMRELRGEFPWVALDSTGLVGGGDGETTWWTFAGLGANATLAAALSEITQSKVTFQDLSLSFESNVRQFEVERAVAAIRENGVDEYHPVVDEDSFEALKFSDCLPEDIKRRIIWKRCEEASAVQEILKLPIRSVV
jgi:ATP-dependent Lhr-like helicase